MRKTSMRWLTAMAVAAALLAGLWPAGYGRAAANNQVLISAVYYDTYLSFEPEEAVRLVNPTAAAVGLGGWSLGNGSYWVSFPAGAALAAGQEIWVGKQATRFLEEFGFSPDFEYETDTDPGVPNLIRPASTPALANDGGQVILKDGAGDIVDVVAWGTSTYSGAGWSGLPVADVTEGQLLIRSRDEATISATSPGEYVADTDTAADWKQGTDWRTNRTFVVGQSFFPYPSFTYTGDVTVYSSPDSSYGVLSGLINGAATRIDLNLYQFQLPQLLDTLTNAIARGVQVRVFLEGGPVGGLTDPDKYVAKQIVQAGGQVRFIVTDSANDIHDRYYFDHAKYAIVDGGKVFVQSENWKNTGTPVNTSAGNRGWGVVVDDAGVAGWMTQVFEADWNPAHKDSKACVIGDPICEPGAGFVPDSSVPTGSYPAPFGSVTFAGARTVTPVVTPDYGLYATNGIRGLIRQAAGTLYVEQLYVHKYWGPSASCNENTCPNLFLKEVLDAARRGVKVRVLLDSAFLDPNDPRDNQHTRDYINQIAAAEGLDMEARLVDLGVTKLTKIHNKGVIVDGRYTLVSSINWSENSPANNREVGLIIDDPQVADFYTDLFHYDWYDGTPVKWPVISEVMFDPPADESQNEWVELHNPTSAALNLGGWTLRDNSAAWTIPSPTVVPAGGTVTIARSGAGFQSLYGFAPTLSGLTLSLANSGDKLSLFDATGFEVDRVAWNNYLPNWSVTAAENATLARSVASQDTNSRIDWTSSAPPTPGSISGSAGGGGTMFDLVISEVYYDTPGNDAEEEFVEIYNPTATAIDVSGGKLEDNAGTWTFPAGASIAPGQFLTVARDTLGYHNLFGHDPDISGLTLSLGNTGDTVKLLDAASAEVDMAAWEGYVAGWTVGAGTGQSIHRKPPAADTDTDADWVAGSATPKATAP